METPPKLAAAWFLTALLGIEAVFIASQARLDFPFLAPALLAAVVIQIRTCRGRLELLATVLVAVGLAMVRFGVHLRPLRDNPSTIGMFIGLASLVVMGAKVVRSPRPEMPQRISAFGVALSLPVFVIVTAVVLPGTAHAHSATLDRVLYAFDGSLGFQPSFVLGRFLSRVPWLGTLAEISYEQVPVAVLVLYASTMGKEERRRPNLLLLFAVASLAGYLLYYLVPAAGPVHLFPSQFPNSAPPLAGLTLLPAVLPADAPRNAMPSLHMTWAVLLFWNARRSGICLRAVYLLYLILTVLITLGSGEHYLIDLVVALPFALAVQAGFSVPIRELPRSLLVWSGAAGTLAWLGFLRFARPVWLGSIVLDWSLVIATVAGTVVLVRQINCALAKGPEITGPRQEVETASMAPWVPPKGA
ncbi:MAG: phosphatase PAP2 family protein [Terriglobia bacterium]|jgi:hypothetical protein